MTLLITQQPDGTFKAVDSAVVVPPPPPAIPNLIVSTATNASQAMADIQKAEARPGASSGGNAENGCWPILWTADKIKADGPITVSKSGHSWSGLGARTTTFEAAVSNAPVIGSSNPANDGLVGCKFRNLAVENIAGLPGVTGIDLQAHREWALENVIVGWCSKTNLYLAGGPVPGVTDNMHGLLHNVNLENAMNGALGQLYADPAKRGAGYLTISGSSKLNGDTSHPLSSGGIVGVLPSCDIQGLRSEGVYQPLDIQGQDMSIEKCIFEVTSGGPMTVRIRANANSWPGGITYSTIAVVLSKNAYQTHGDPTQFKLQVDSGCVDVYQDLDDNPAGNPFLISRKLA